MTFGDYTRLHTYHADLLARYEARSQWLERHPDHNTPEYHADEHDYELRQGGFLPASTDRTPQSSFNPTDPEPSTSDVLSASLLLNIMAVSLEAWKKAHLG